MLKYLEVEFQDVDMCQHGSSYGIWMEGIPTFSLGNFNLCVCLKTFYNET